MFIEILKNKFVNLNQATIIEVKQSIIMFRTNRKIFSFCEHKDPRVPKAVLKEIMTRYNEGRRVITYDEYQLLISEISLVFCDDD